MLFIVMFSQVLIMIVKLALSPSTIKHEFFVDDTGAYIVELAYEDSLRSREKDLKKKPRTAEQDSQEKDQKCTKLENDMFSMQKEMASITDKYTQQQELLEKLQEKGETAKCEII